ncbi:hypothetical protein [Reinekea sp.]|jgi:hypothetical protein|uniref:hypothetical protein n=1 Tax=Reinekea sp. TaxID=1970455 RepID=UPI002A818D99|nr:hypothetical protein [Reinekea sp.]
MSTANEVSDLLQKAINAEKARDDAIAQQESNVIDTKAASTDVQRAQSDNTNAIRARDIAYTKHEAAKNARNALPDNAAAAAAAAAKSKLDGAEKVVVTTQQTLEVANTSSNNLKAATEKTDREVTDTKLKATSDRAVYTTALQDIRGSNFDFDPAEELFLSSEYGTLLSPFEVPPGGEKKERERLNLTDLQKLNGTQFYTSETDRYIWTRGNTYTFGGGSDYAFANGYGVSMSYDAIDDENFKTWDGNFPYDIFAPPSTPIPTPALTQTSSQAEKDAAKKAAKDGAPNSRDSNFTNSFDKLPEAYKVSAVIPEGIFMRSPSSDVDFAKNTVGKNIGHTYGYQLGDTHSIQLSKNTSSVTAVDRANSFESTEISESHSHVGIAASFDAHGMDASLGIKALDIGINVSGVNFGVSIKAADITFGYTLFKFDYSKVQFECKLVDGPKFNLSKKTQQLDLEKVETIAVEGILLQVDSDPALNEKGKDLLGAADEKGKKWLSSPYSDAVGTFSAKGKILESDYNRVVEASTNPKRRAVALAQRASFSRVAVEKTSVKLASYSNTGDALSEFVLDSMEKQIELKLHDKETVGADAGKNTTQMFDLDKGLYYVSHYEEKEGKYIGKMWVAKEAPSTGDIGEKKITANSGGIYVQKIKDNYASLNLDAEKNVIDLASQKDADNLVDLQADSGKNKFSLEVKKASDVATLLMDAATGESKWHAKKGSKEFTIKHKDNLTVSFKDGKESKLVLEKELVKITSKKFVVGVGSNIVAEKAGIKLQSKEVKVGKMTVKDMDVTIPQPKVTIGKSAKIAITAAGLDIKGPKISISGSGVAEIKGAMIKIG